MFEAAYAAAERVAAQRRRSSYLSLGLLGEGFLSAPIDFDLKMFDEAEEDGLAGPMLFNSDNTTGAASRPAHSQTHQPLMSATVVPAGMQQSAPGGSKAMMDIPSTPMPAHKKESMISPKHADNRDARKRKTAKKFGKVISTIKSNRAKPAKTIVLEETPKKEERIKGAVYQIGESRKKWDGRQWRRLCVVQDCCSAARGATDFCIVHGRGEITKAIVGDEEVEVLALTEQKAAAVSAAAAVLGRQQSSPHHTHHHIEHLQRKRKSEDETDATGKLHKVIKTMETHTIGTPKHGLKVNTAAPASSDKVMCQFITALGDQCGNVISPTEANFPYCYSCWCYVNSPHHESRTESAAF